MRGTCDTVRQPSQVSRSSVAQAVSTAAHQGGLRSCTWTTLCLPSHPVGPSRQVPSPVKVTLWVPLCSCSLDSWHPPPLATRWSRAGCGTRALGKPQCFQPDKSHPNHPLGLCPLESHSLEKSRVFPSLCFFGRGN